ncbi:MAG TPA: hypothetical protein VFQ49_14855, partial [Actinomycetes bacterium]|nr:hypothetical protein [Actinomycetes bacterium]
MDDAARLEAARDAYRRRDWVAARQGFTAARAAGELAAAPGGDEHEVERARLLEQLARRGPGAGHDPRVVVRVDRREALA